MGLRCGILDPVGRCWYQAKDDVEVHGGKGSGVLGRVLVSESGPKAPPTLWRRSRVSWRARCACRRSSALELATEGLQHSGEDDPILLLVVGRVKPIRKSAIQGTRKVNTASHYASLPYMCRNTQQV